MRNYFNSIIGVVNEAYNAPTILRGDLLIGAIDEQNATQIEHYRIVHDSPLEGSESALH